MAKAQFGTVASGYAHLDIDARQGAFTALASTLVLGLGNELLADDAVGIIAVRRLRALQWRNVDLVETAMHGVALLDLFVGYDVAIVIDAIMTGQHPVGTILDIDPMLLRPIENPSPHYAGLPELLVLAQSLELAFPPCLRIVAVEAQDLLTIGGPMSAAVQDAIPNLCGRVENLIRRA